MSAAQTLWTDVVVAALAEAGVVGCVVSPGSRSTPLVTALARHGRLPVSVIIDERAAAFYALGAARATGRPVALVCTSGSAPGHYLPAVIEAAMAEVPLVVLSADRPPELQDAGASQTIPQTRLFGDQVRLAADLGPPTADALALRAVRRRVVQAVTTASGPLPGPVHLNVPLRKPLEPIAPSTAAEQALAAEARRLTALPPAAQPPVLAPAPAMVAELAQAIAAEPRGLIVAGALPESFAVVRDELLALAAAVGYPVLAESGSQLRLTPRPADLVAIDRADLVLSAWQRRSPDEARPQLVLQLGAEPVASGWHTAASQLTARAQRWVLARRWQDPTSTARVVLGDPAMTIAALRAALDGSTLAPRPPAYRAAWTTAQREAAAALDAAIVRFPDSEVAALGAALAACRELAAAGRAPRLVLGNSLPVRVADWIAAEWPAPVAVQTQRGASGIDGALAGAAGATWDGRPVLAVIGDVTFAHDAGSLALLASARAPLALVVLDNSGGRIFDHLPVAHAGLPQDDYERFFTTAPRLDPVAVARGFGVRAEVVRPADLTAVVRAALAAPGATLIHVPVASEGALSVRTAALAELVPTVRMVQGATS